MTFLRGNLPAPVYSPTQKLLQTLYFKVFRGGFTAQARLIISLEVGY